MQASHQSLYWQDEISKIRNVIGLECFIHRTDLTLHIPICRDMSNIYSEQNGRTLSFLDHNIGTFWLF